MLEIIYNIALTPNVFYDKGYNSSNIIDEPYLYKSFFYKLKESLLSKEIDLLNISIEKKKNDDKNIICTNFGINHLLNLLNKKDKDLNINNMNNTESQNRQKKKIEQHKNILLDDFLYLKKIKTDKIKKNQKQLQRLNIKLLSHQFKKNKKSYVHKDELNNINIKNNLHLIKLNNQYNHEKIDLYNTNKDNITNIKNEKHIVFFTDFKNHKNSLFSSKKINHIDNLLRYSYSLKDTDQSKSLKLKTEPLFFYNSENSIEWKKLVSQKILLSISNKDNQAKIYLKPETLGSIYIKINMKDDEATLSFISSHNEVRMFLDNYVPFLRDSLKKNGIKLRKVNISSSLKNQKIKNSKKFFYNNIFDSDRFKTRLNIYKKNKETLKCQFIDVYV